METIFAMATAPGRAGVSVVRISGPQAFEAVRLLAGDVPSARRAALRVLRDDDGTVLDEALVLTFEAGKSFTGEKVAELQLHGSLAVQKAVLARLERIEGLRGAEPGEFTRRALANDRMDLTQVEALSDLIEAETEIQRKQALEVLSGALGRRVEDWREGLIRAASLLEATIDFADEEVPVDVTGEVVEILTALQADFQREVQGLSAAERVRSGFEVAIVGLPNAGKSTLLNHLAGREAALTSDIAGTTRDVIEVRMDIGGLPVTLLDTAGLRETLDPVEQMGVARAIARAEAADLRVHLVTDGQQVGVGIESDDLVLQPKMDDASDGIGVSGLTGAGVSWLLDQLQDRLSSRVQSAGLASRERHRAALLSAQASLDQALGLLDSGPEVYDLVSEDLRQAARALERLLGRVDVEDVLDRIFANFCIGK